jgi:hypothetical protein
MANEPQEKQSQYALFSFGILGVAYQQPSPGGPVMACPPWSPPESVLWKHLKLPKEEPQWWPSLVCHHH